MHLFEHFLIAAPLARADAVLSSWTTRLTDWLRGRGLLKSAGAQIMQTATGGS
jgi:hypothetical protein